MVDQVENFVRVSVSGTHSDGATTISLQSGEASKLPSVSNGKYNLVWFNSSNYISPDEDPNVEIVRVNSIDTSNDTVSVTRGRENTTASTKNEVDVDYELILTPTAKTIKDIDSEKLDETAYSPEADTHSRYTDSEAVAALEAGRLNEIAFNNIGAPSDTRSIGVDDSEGPIFQDTNGNNYPIWNSENVNAGTDISISGGTGSADTPITIAHSNTSNQGNVSANAGAAITDISVDGRGHTTSIGTTDFDSRFVLESGDTMSGDLTFPQGNKITLNRASDGLDILNFYVDSNDTAIIDGNRVNNFQIRSDKGLGIEFDRGQYDVRFSIAGGGTEYFAIDENSNIVDVSSADLRLDTGRAIEDGGGNNRLEINTSETFVSDETGTGRLILRDGDRIGLNPDSTTPFNIYDTEGGFYALEYTTSASEPGLLALTKSHLDLNNNNIVGVNEITINDPGQGEGLTYPNFQIYEDESNGDLVIRDDANGVDLIRQPPAGPTEFIQGADIGSIEAPDDSLTQILNASATSSATSGDPVGYTFAVDNQTGLKVSATANGSGGLSSSIDIDVPNGTISEQGNRVATRTWATENNINHSDLANAPSSSHHSRYTDNEARSAVTATKLPNNLIIGQSSALYVRGDDSNHGIAYGGGGGYSNIDGPDIFGFEGVNIYGTQTDQTIAHFNDNGNVNVPNGQLSEQGNRVATRTWANSNLVNESGDTMSGDLKLGSNAVTFAGVGDQNTVLQSPDSPSRLRVQGQNSTEIGRYSGGFQDYIFINATGSRLKTYGYNWAVTDTTNNQQIISFNEGGTVNVSNGDLNITGGKLRVGDGTNSIINGKDSDVFIRSQGSNAVRLSDETTRVFSTGGIVMENGDVRLGDNSVQTNNFEVTENSSTNSLDFNYTGS